MTVNVAVKCPDGIVMGADSLVTISAGGPPIALIPYYGKLFPLGDYAAAAMINGAGSVGGRDIQTVVEEFASSYGEPAGDYSLADLAESLRDFVQNEIQIRAAGQNPLMEIIVGGYSRGTRAEGKVYGEIYSLKWENGPGAVRAKYVADEEFGVHYGGQPQALDRFHYGFDDWSLGRMLERRAALFEQGQDYILGYLRERGHNIPASLRAPMPRLNQFNVLSLVSDFEFGETAGETIKKVKDGTVERFYTMERFFSLQVAIDYCVFLMSCAYAVNNFTYTLPGVGSEATVLSITRRDGVRYEKSWETRAPELSIP
jgi:hypothetical protein